MISLVKDGSKELIENSPESWSIAQRGIIQRVIKNLQPLLLKRAQSRKPMCLNHGDAALWNFVLDKNVAIPAKVVDFQELLKKAEGKHGGASEHKLLYRNSHLSWRRHLCNV